MREPLAWTLADLERSSAEAVHAVLARSERGTWLVDWTPPVWLLPHQAPAARRLAGSLLAFGGALLADAVGMGKTYTALGIATRYRRVTVVVPARLTAQWQRVAAHLSIPVATVSHERLSRGGSIPPSDLVIVDEAHRLRNPETVRYDRCARTLGNAHVLLVTATPVVNGVSDLVNLLRLVLPDDALGFLGLPPLDSIDDPALTGHFARVATRFTVARPTDVLADQGVSLPTICDGKVIRAATVPERGLPALVDALDALEYPGVPDGARHLLRAHAWHRLASSVAALRETMRRQLVYTDRALSWGTREAPGRRIVRELLGLGDDLQFELGCLLAGNESTDVAPGVLTAERERLLSLLRLLRAGTRNPKSERLTTLLRERPSQTIVFCGSTATALELAHSLGWKRLAVVAGGKARIASGPIAFEAALDLFAPVARRAERTPARRTRVDLLITTDLVSEGLDLQDADTVVHYDLPWTPLRLAQRVGRVVRLGSLHPCADVLWFAPPITIEHRLRLERQHARKMAVQLALSVPSTSGVGRARVVNATLAARELFCAEAVGDTTGEPVLTRSAFAVVRGPLALAAAIRWRTARGSVDELLVIGGSPPRVVESYSRIVALISRLRRGVAEEDSIPSELQRALLATLRERLRAAAWPPVGGDVRRVRRLVLLQGFEAGKQRDLGRLSLLDRVLNLLRTGRRAGTMRQLESLITAGGDRDALRRWITACPPTVEGAPELQVLAILAGDGSEP